MISQLRGTYFLARDQGVLPTLKLLCRKGVERVHKSGFERFDNWEDYFAYMRSRSVHRDDPVDSKWIEFVCPFHRGDVIVGFLAASAAAQAGKRVRMYVCRGMGAWLSDFPVCENLCVVELQTALPTALETQPRYHSAVKEVMNRPEARGRFASSRPIRTLEAAGADLAGYMLLQLGMPADTPLPKLYPRDCGEAEKKRLRSLIGCPEEPFILLHPQGGWRIKSMSPDVVKRIIAQAQTAGCRAIQIGGSADRPVSGTDGAILQNLRLSEWQYLFRSAVALVGVDSWTAHFASLLNVPQAIVYGATVDGSIGLKRHMLCQEGQLLILDSRCELAPCNKTYCRRGFEYCAGMEPGEGTICDYLDRIKNGCKSCNTIC